MYVCACVTGHRCMGCSQPTWPALAADGIAACVGAAITQLVHHGMIYVPTGYTYSPDMYRLDHVRRCHYTAA